MPKAGVHPGHLPTGPKKEEDIGAHINHFLQIS
jgi:hypothetical protein